MMFIIVTDMSYDSENPGGTGRIRFVLSDESGKIYTSNANFVPMKIIFSEFFRKGYFDKPYIEFNGSWRILSLSELFAEFEKSFNSNLIQIPKRQAAQYSNGDKLTMSQFHTLIQEFVKDMIQESNESFELYKEEEIQKLADKLDKTSRLKNNQFEKFLG